MIRCIGVFSASPMTRKARPKPRPRSAGVIVSADDKGSYVLTNDHVVNGSSDIQLAFADGRVMPAKVVGSIRNGPRGIAGGRQGG
jgi:S1-C subfamily serine protease